MLHKNYEKTLDENLKKQFVDTYKFSNHNNKSLFYCCKKVFDCMDDWQKFSETLIPQKKYFYGHLNMEYITVVDYNTRKEFVKISK